MTRGLAPGFETRAGEEHWSKLSGAVAGHHGRPVEAATILGVEAEVNAPFEAAAGEVTQILIDLFGVAPLSAPLVSKDRDAAALSWFLSAVTPVADWIGSNQAWFPAHAADCDPLFYWNEVARPSAARAIAAAGLTQLAPSARPHTFVLPPLANPTPLQSHVLECPLPEGPALFVIEDATGSGKTEAALMLTHRLMQADRADGFYFALPTTATADAMYARLAPGYRAFFEKTEDTAPSLVLSHGAVKRRSAEEMPVAAWCAEWIADDRRKTFLAQTGAGTVDQALLTILPAKYQSLRLFGLHGKVLIVDEVHAYDSYMLKELSGLLELHALLGGSAILMSATLPIAIRANLIEAFQRGCGLRRASRPQSQAYPLLSVANIGGLIETPLSLSQHGERRVTAARLDDVDSAEAKCLSLARDGACVALIRSTVDCAINSFARLCALHEGRVQLLHSRFLPQDRTRIEQDILRRFGKTSTQGERQGRILVATQVIEQSLDLDFDAVFSDLAPIDMLIQRAGRLWRHRRAERPLSEPVLHVIAPKPCTSDGADWLDEKLPEARWVYRDPAVLWLSADALFRAGGIAMLTLASRDEAPDHARRLVEAVYGDDPSLPTQGLRQARDHGQGEHAGKAALARYAILTPSSGYAGNGQSWEAEGVVSTRLEELRRVVVRLAVDCEGALRPLAEAGDWIASEVRVTEHWAKTIPEPDETQIARLAPPWPEADRGCRILVLEKGDDAYRTSTQDFVYRRNLGLAANRDSSPKSTN